MSLKAPPSPERQLWAGLLGSARLKRRILAFVLASFMSGLLEAALLALVAQLAVVIGGSVGPAQLPWPLSGFGGTSVSTLVFIGLAGCALRLLCQLVVASVPAHLMAEVQALLRRRIVEGFAWADWLTQVSIRDGQLQETATGQADQTATSLLVFLNGTSAAVSLLVLLASALILNPPAAAAILVTIGLLYVILRPLSKLVRKSAAATVEANLNFASSITETTQLNTEIYTLGVTELATDRIRSVIHGAMPPLRRTNFLHGLVPGLYQSSALGLVLASLFFAHRVDPSSLASLGAIILMLLRVLSYGSTVQAAVQRLTDTRMYITQFCGTLGMLEAARRITGTEHLTTVEHIELRHAGYSYGRGADAIEDVTVGIQAGDVVGITGPSGSGKTTFANILCRLLQPTAGEHLVNGRPATEYAQGEWAKRFAFVPQDGRLLSGSIVDNVRFFRKGFTVDDVITAAKSAHIHDEIMSWPNQYDTYVSQRADAVSGGERQRLCLARALVGAPEVLVLDEPTSSLDPRSEDLVLRSLDQLRGRVTMIVVTHRASVLKLCDSVVWMKDGHVERVTDSRARGHATQ